MMRRSSAFFDFAASCSRNLRGEKQLYFLREMSRHRRKNSLTNGKSSPPPYVEVVNREREKTQSFFFAQELKCGGVRKIKMFRNVQGAGGQPAL